jgi:hypothetical protein
MRAGNVVGAGTLGPLQRAFDAMKVASALREAMWAMVSAIHPTVQGADYGAHATDYLSRTEAALSRYAERHGGPLAAATSA